MEAASLLVQKIEYMKNNDFQNRFPILTSVIRAFLTIPAITAS